MAPESRPVVAVVDYNRPDLTLSTVRDLVFHEPLVRQGNVRVFVMENGCDAELIKAVRKDVAALGMNNIQVVVFDDPIPYSACCNWLHRKHPGAPCYFYLNNDLIIRSPILSAMVSTLRDSPETGIVTPLMNSHYAGQNIDDVHWNEFPSLPIWGLREDGLVQPSDITQFNNKVRTLVDTGSVPPFYRHEYAVAFSCVGVRREVIEDIGGQDELFPYGLGADIDFCFRALRYGWKITTVLDVFVGHIWKASLSKVDRLDEMREQSIRMTDARWRNVVSDDDLISVIVPAYNCGKYLWNCLRSLLNQSYPHREIIVIDDCSTDETQDVLGYFNVIKLRNKRNLGACVSRNKGYRVSRGKYVVFCDADAVYEDDYLSRLHDVLKNAPSDIGYSYCDFRIEGMSTGTHYSGEWSEEKLRMENFIETPALIRRDVFPGFDPALPRMQDWDVWLTLAKRGIKGVHVNRTLYTSHKRPEGITGRGSADRVMAMQVVREKHDI